MLKSLLVRRHVHFGLARASFSACLKFIGTIGLVVLIGAACSSQGNIASIPAETTAQVDQPVSASTQAADEDAAYAGMIRYYEVRDAIRHKGGIAEGAPIPETVLQVTLAVERDALVDELKELNSQGYTIVGDTKVLNSRILRADEAPHDAAESSINIFAGCIDRRDLRRNPGNEAPSTDFLAGKLEMQKATDGLWKVARLRQVEIESC